MSSKSSAAASCAAISARTSLSRTRPTSSREFGVSRSVIREAVKSLAAKGLLESRTRTGIRVLPPVHWNLLDAEVLSWRYSADAAGAVLRASCSRSAR